MGTYQFSKTFEVRAPIERVFERLTDHEAMGEWPGVSSCTLIREGTPRNGVGAVRRLRVAGTTIDEEIVLFEPPHRYDYTIIKGIPVEHRGTVQLVQSGDLVRATWEIRLASRWPLLAEVAGFLLGRGLPPAIAHFRRQFDRSA